MTTIKAHLISLREDFAQKTDAYLKAEQKLFEEGNGFNNPNLLADLSEAKTEWQQAGNAYNTFLSHVVNHRLNIDAEMG